MDSKLKIGEKSKVVIQWNVLPINYSREKADEMASKMAKKYGIPKQNVSIEPRFIKKNKNGKEEAVSTEVVNNIQDPKFQQKLFKEYLEENGIKDYDFDEILKIDNQMNSLIDYSVYDKYRRYEIEWVEWSNFLSYGPNNRIDFRDLKGLVLLKSEPANQGGKTNFACDLIKFLLFGKVDSGKADVLKKIFNKHLPEETEVKVEGGLCIDGEHYVIKRTLTRPALKRRTAKSNVTQKVEYYKVVGDSYEELLDIDNLKGESNVKTNQIIKEAIGNDKDFNLVVCANSDNLKELVSMKDTERGRLLSKWIGLLPLEEKFNKSKEKWNKEISVSLFTSKYDKDVLSTEIEDLKSFIETNKNAIKENNEKLKAVEGKIKELNSNKELLLSSKQNIESDIANEDVHTLQKRMEDIVNEGREKRKQIEDFNKRLKEIGNIEFSENVYNEKSNEERELDVKNQTLKNTIKEKKNTIEALKKGEYCPYCGQKLLNVDNSKAIKQAEDDIKKMIEEGVKNKGILDKLREELKNMENNRNLFVEKNKVELNIATTNVAIERLLNEHAAKKMIVEKIKRNETAIKTNNQIDIKVYNLNASIKVEDANKTNLLRETERIEAAIEVQEKGISDRQIIINKIDEEAPVIRAWKIYLEMIGKDGISKMVLRNTLPIINGELKRLLSDVCDFDVEVSIDDRNDISFSIIADGIRSDLSSGSGFEQTVASLALRAVLGNISTMSRPSFMLLDEVLGGVARENYDNIKKLYDRMLKDYSFIFQVTHLDDIADWHNTTVVVKKENRVSHISIAK